MAGDSGVPLSPSSVSASGLDVVVNRFMVGSCSVEVCGAVVELVEGWRGCRAGVRLGGVLELDVVIVWCRVAGSSTAGSVGVVDP
jgi:hypothetical protein